MHLFNTIGIMSGTSLDGLDIVLCNFTFDKKWTFNIIKYQTINYSNEWNSRLKNAHDLTGYELMLLHKEFGQFIGECILKFTEGSNVKIDLIASHGHTVFHQPEKKLTLQIGDGAIINSVTGITTISDFRSLDVALGGQGAPLVPIGDQLLFSEFDFCINIGGFANISFQENNKRLAYDICPANIILNQLATKLGLNYDNEGKLGSSGNINNELLSVFNNMEYYRRKYPKSLGREWLEKEFIPILESSNLPIIDQMATIYEHIASQIANSINYKSNTKALMTGGGAYNKHLIELIKGKTLANIIIPDKATVEYKEALIFAFLGVLRLNNQTNCLASVTGARKDSSSGIIHQ